VSTIIKAIKAGQTICHQHTRRGEFISSLLKAMDTTEVKEQKLFKRGRHDDDGGLRTTHAEHAERYTGSK
jgi:hypothetical protein